MMTVPNLGRWRECNLAYSGKLFFHVFVSVKSIPEAPMSRMRMVELLVLVRMPVLGDWQCDGLGSRCNLSRCEFLSARERCRRPTSTMLLWHASGAIHLTKALRYVSEEFSQHGSIGSSQR